MQMCMFPRNAIVDDETQLQQTSTQLKEEKQARRQLDSQLNAVQEELTELRIARDNLEKVNCTMLWHRL